MTIPSRPRVPARRLAREAAAVFLLACAGAALIGACVVAPVVLPLLGAFAAAAAGSWFLGRGDA